MEAILAASAGALAAMAGLALGRLVHKTNPAWPLCSTCEGRWGLPAGVVPGLAPRSCPECRRSVALPTILTVLLGAVFLARDAMAGGGEGLFLLVADVLLVVALAALVWTDARYRVLPARVIWGATALSLVPLALADHDVAGSRFSAAIAAAALSGLGFLVLHLVSPEGLAFGDVRLAVLLGLHLGWRSVPNAFWAFFAAVALGALVGLLWKWKRGTTTLPFGPFMALGAVTVLLVGGT
jgi:leader peptidase (prepilin peptidase) / N-methyltransferase